MVIIYLLQNIFMMFVLIIVNILTRRSANTGTFSALQINVENPRHERKIIIHTINMAENNKVGESRNHYLWIRHRMKILPLYNENLKSVQYSKDIHTVSCEMNFV